MEEQRGLSHSQILPGVENIGGSYTNTERAQVTSPEAHIWLEPNEGRHGAGTDAELELAPGSVRSGHGAGTDVELELAPGSARAEGSVQVGPAAMELAPGSVTNGARERLWLAAPGGLILGTEPADQPSWYPGPTSPRPPGVSPWEPWPPPGAPGSGAGVGAGLEISVGTEPAGQQFINHPADRRPALVFRRNAYALGLPF